MNHVNQGICPVFSNRTAALSWVLPGQWFAEQNIAGPFLQYVETPFAYGETMKGAFLGKTHLWDRLSSECSENGLLDAAQKIQCFIRKLEPLISPLLAACKNSAQSAYCPIKNRMEEMLEEESKIAIDDRLLEHILGGHFGKGSGLEGYSQKAMIEYIAESIPHRLDTLKRSLSDTHGECPQAACERELAILEELDRQFKKAKEIGSFLERRDFTGFSTRIVQELQQLPKGKSFFFQGGWVGTPGHGMIYEVIKEGMESFAFRFYNRGAGLQHHESFQSQWKTFFLPFVEIVEIPFNNLSREVVLKAFHDLQQMPSAGRDWTEEDIYSTLISALGGKISDRQYTDEQYLEALRVGNCSYLSLSAWMSQAAQSSHLFRQWEFDLQLKTLWNYYLQHRDPLPKSSLMLVAKSIEQIARNSKVAYMNKALSLEEWSFVNKRLEEVKNFFNAHELTSRLSFAREERASFSHPEWIPATWSAQNISEPFSYPEAFVRGDLFISSELERFKYDPQWIEEMSKIHQEIRDAMGDRKTPEALTVFRIKSGLERLARALSLKKIQQVRAETLLKADQARKAVALIAELARDYLWASLNASYFQADRRSHTSLEEYMTAVKFLTLADAICQQFSSDECLHLPNLFQSGMDFEDVGPVADYQLAQEIDHIRSYWEKSKDGKAADGNSFFGYESYPAAFALSDPPVVRCFDFSQEESPWQDLNWARDQLISHREMREKIREKSPHLAQQNIWVQGASCLSGIYLDSKKGLGDADARVSVDNIFPQTFFDLRDLSFIVDSVLRNDNAKAVKGAQRSNKFTSWTWINHFDLSLIIRPLEAFGRGLLKRGYAIENIREGEKEIPTSLDRSHRLKSSHDPLKELFSFYQKELKERKTTSQRENEEEAGNKNAVKEKQGPYGGQRFRMEPHHRLVKGPVEKFSLEETKELYGLSSLPSHQIIDTFFYFRDRVHLLAKNRQYQTFFKHLMFEPPLLRDVFKGENGSVFAKHVSSFCENYFRAFQEQGDIPMAIYFLELSRLFKQVAGLSGITLKLPNCKTEIEVLLQKTDLSERDEALLKLELLHDLNAGAFSENEKKEEREANVVKGVSSAIWMGKFGINPEDRFASMAKVREVRDLMTRFQGPILSALGGENGDRILNEIASNLLKRTVETTWTSDKGIYRDKEQKIYIDPIGARIYEKGQDSIKAPIPYRIKNLDPGILQTFGQAEIFAQEVDFGKFSLQNTGGEEFQFIEHGQGMYVQRKIGKQWCSLMTEVPENFPVAWRQHHFWQVPRTPKYSGENEIEIWISDPKDGRLIAQVLGKTSVLEIDLFVSSQITSAFEPKIIYQLDKEQKRTGLKLGAMKKKTLKFLTVFEEPEYILPWISVKEDNVSGNGILSQIELPRFGLSFLVGKSGRAHCKEIEGYAIAKNQHIPSLGQLTNYLVLSHEKKHENKGKLVLFPKLPLTQVDASLNLQTRPEVGKQSRISYISYEFNKQGNLVPIGDRGDEARFFLAMMMLWEHEYDKALKFLLEHGSQIQRFSKGEIEILKWIVELDRRNRDQSPIALAIRLKAGMEIVKNQLDFGRDGDEKEAQEFLSGLTKLYYQVMEKADQIPERFAPTQEERHLLLGLSKLESSRSQNISTSFLQQKMPNYFWAMRDLFLALSTEIERQENRKAFAKEKFSLLYADGLTTAFIRNLYRWARHPSVESYGKLYASLTDRASIASLSLTDLYRLFHQKEGREEKAYLLERDLELETIYREVMGRDLPAKQTRKKSEKEVHLALLKEEILLALRMIWSSQSKDEDRMAAAILARVLESPERFKTEEHLLELFQSSDQNMISNFGKFQSAFDSSVIFDEKGILNLEPLRKAQDRGTCFLGVPNELEQCAWVDSSAQPISWSPSLPDIGEIEIQAPISGGDIPSPSQRLVLKEPLIAAFKEQRDKGFIELSGLFSPGGERDRPAKWYLEKLVQRLKEFADFSSQDAGSYSLNGKCKWEFNQYVRQVEYEISRLRKSAMDRTRDNLLEIQKLLQKSSSTAGYEWQKSGELSGDIDPIDLESLFYFFALKDGASLSNINPSLDREEIAKIFALIQDVLLDKTGLQYLDRLGREIANSNDVSESILINQEYIRHGKKFAGEYKAKRQEIQQRYWFQRLWTSDERALEEYLISKFRQPNFDPEENILVNERNLARFLRELDQLSSIENSKRAYRVEEHPEYLVFEYFNDILLRPKQIENLEKLGSSAATILEMIMAGGKTSVLLPLIALKRADGKTIPLLVMPDQLVAETAKTLRQRLKKSFDHRVEILEIKREEINLGQLQRIEHRLRQAQIDKKAVLMSGSSLQTLFLGAIERFAQFADLKNRKSFQANPVEELDAIRRILGLFRTDSDLVLDEVDLMFDVLRTHQFTIGGAQSMDEKLLDAVTEFYRLSIEKVPSIAWAFLSASKGRIFSHNNEDKKMVIDAIIAKENIPEKKHQQIYDFFDEREGLEEFMDQLPRKTRDFLAVCKEELNTVFPLTERKRVDEHYGALPAGKHKFGSSPFMAIPYHGCNSPVIGSEFGSDLEVINYTIQLHLFHPIPKEIIESKVQSLQIGVQSGLKKNLPLEKIDAFQEFLSLGAKGDAFARPEIAVEQIQKSLERDLGKKLSFIRQEILPGLKTYQKQIRTDGHIYPHLAKQVLGFSGTLWNADTYPKIFRDIYVSDTEPSTLLRLWEDCSQQKISILDGSLENKEGIAKVFSSFYESAKEPLSIIDLGGVFRGISNRQAAEELLKLSSFNNHKISGIIFFEKDHAMVLKTGKDDPIDLAGIPKEERGQLIAFWDQKHTTGTDLQGLDPKMKAMVTVSRYTMMRDLMQASWRLRGLDKSQKVFFALPSQEKEVISQKLKLDPKREQELSLAELFQYVKEVEISRQSSDNFRALQRKLMDVIATPLLSLFFNPQLSWEWKKKHLYPSMKELFVSEKTTDLFQLYGRPNQEIKAEEAIRKEVGRLHDIVDRFSNRLIKQIDIQEKGQEESPLSRIKRAITEISECSLDNLPEKVRKHVTYETEVEVEQELEVNQEVKRQTVQVIEPRPIVAWPFKNLSEHYFRPISREDWYLVDLDFIYMSEFLDAKALTGVSKQLSLNASKAREEDVPLIRVNDVLDKHRFRQCVDRSLLTTMNLMPTYYTPGDAVPFELFGPTQDVSKRALIVRSKQNRDPHEGLLYVMLAPWDAFQWELFLQSGNAVEEIKKSPWEIGLFHWDLGFYRGMNDDEWSRDWKQQFQKLNVQAKFLSGKLDYTDDETNVLKDWIEKEKIEEQFFAQNILRAKSKTSENYQGSDVWQILRGKK